MHSASRWTIRSIDRVIGLLALVAVVVTVIRFRDKPPIALLSSRVVQVFLSRKLPAPSPSHQVIVVLFKPSECGQLLEYLFRLSRDEAEGKRTVLAVAVTSSDSLKYVEDLLRTERIPMRVTSLSQKSATAFLRDYTIRQLPAAFSLHGNGKFERIGTLSPTDLRL